MIPSTPKKVRKVKVKGYAIVSKYDGRIMEAFHDFEMNDTFESLRAARMYIKKIFTKKQWPNYTRDIKVVPCVITFSLPVKKK